MQKKIEEIIQEVIQDDLFLHEYTKVENSINNPNFNVKLTLKIGKRTDKNMQIILHSEEGIERFKELLTHSDLRVRFTAARYLYPILPKESLAVMKEYRNSLSDDFEEDDIDNIIDGLQKKLPVFMEQFKQLYGENYEKYSVID